MNWLTAIYAEQTTPDEVVIFLMLGTFLTLLIAFFIYAVVLVVLSRWRMKEGYTLRMLLFPSAARIRKYSAEYAMGTLTALLLALTVSSKHVAVQSVLAHDIGAVGHQTIREALPFGRLDAHELVDVDVDADTAEKIAAWLADGVARPAAISAESMVRPLLEAGMSENANMIVRAIVNNLPTVSNSKILQRALLVSAVLLLLGYVLWFGVQRWKELQQSRANEPGYASIIKRLSLPAVCIPLLLVSAVALEDSERIVKSTVAAAAVTSTAVETPISRVIENQVAVISSRGRLLDASDLEQLNQNLQRLGKRVDASMNQVSSLESRLRDSETALDAAAAKLGRNADARASDARAAFAALKDGLSDVQTILRDQLDSVAELAREARANAGAAAAKIGPLEQAIAELDRNLRGLGTSIKQQGTRPGLLLVQNFNGNGRYTIQQSSNNSGAGSGTTVGLHVLAPGTYRITGNGSGQVSRRIQSDRAQTVIFQRVVQ